jgi:hypothetical protein
LVHTIEQDESPEEFMEMFCHKYTNLNTSLGDKFPDRMQADIEKREKRQEEIEKAQKAYDNMQHPPLNKEEKERIHYRLHSDAYARTHNLHRMVEHKEEEELKHFKSDKRTVSKKRINQFVQRVNDEIIENQKTLEKKRKIKELKEEIEYQKIKNRSISRGKLSKERELELVNKMVGYEKHKWENQQQKVEEKKQKMENQMSQYFKPHISESSKKLALKKRSKKSGIVTGGKTLKQKDQSLISKNEEVAMSLQGSIFDRLYNDSKANKRSICYKSQIQIESLTQENGLDKAHLNDSSSHMLLRSKNRPTPSFQANRKASPLSSIDIPLSSSPVVNGDQTKLVMSRYLLDSSKAKSNVRVSVNSNKYKSHGANSP